MIAEKNLTQQSPSVPTTASTQSTKKPSWWEIVNSFDPNVKDKYLVGLETNHQPFEIPASFLSNVNPAKNTTTLSRIKNFYIVPNVGQFAYFRIDSLEDAGPHLFKLKDTPPVLREGFVVVDKVVYFVTVDDLKRRVVRKSRKLNLVTRTLTYEDFITGAAYIKPTTSTTDSGLPPQDAAVGKGGPESSASADRPNPEISSIFGADSGVSTKDPRKSRASSIAELDESEIINLDLTDEIRSLLGLDPEEED